MLILTVLQGPDKGKRFELPDREPQLIGRSSEAIPTQDQTISRRHCELTPDNGRWYVNDLDSSNGTYVNGLRVIARRRLEPGDQIRTGNTLFLFGMEVAEQRRKEVRVAPPEEDLDVSIDLVAPSNDDSVIMAVPEPTEAAVVQLKVIYEITQLIGTVADRQELLKRIMDLIFSYFQADRGYILLQEGESDHPDPVVVRHRVPPKSAKAARIPISRTIVQHVIKKGEGVLSSNAMADQRFSGGDSVRDMRIRSTVCVPIKYKDHIFGVVHLDSQVVNYTFTEDQLKLLTAIGVHTGLALANAELYAGQLQRERLAAVGQTVASLSHSVRNIIQGLRGGADVVELGLRKDSMKVVRGGWEIVARNLERIHALTLNMLAYSKQRKPELELVSLNKLLSDAAEMMQQQYDQKKAALIADLEQDLPPIPMDSAGIHQAVLNLLNNALDAIEPKTGVVSVRSEYDDSAGEVRIIVHDNGVGISREASKHLFEPFHSTKGLRGTGLGLVVTKKVVDEHNGTISVDSDSGKGTTFTITLPVTTDEVPALADTQGPTAEK